MLYRYVRLSLFIHVSHFAHTSGHEIAGTKMIGTLILDPKTTLRGRPEEVIEEKRILTS